MEIDNLDNGALDQSGILIAYVNGTANYVIDNSIYTAGSGFLPNTRYQYRGQVKYPWSTLVPTAGPQIRGPIYTVPANPAKQAGDGVTAFTHVTATVLFHNSVGPLPNPIGTQYEIRYVPSSGPTVFDTVTSTLGTMAESFTRLTAGLQDGMFYTASARALNRGRASGWADSGWTTLGTFTTVPWGLTLTINPATVFKTSATATISVTDNSGLDHYYIRYSPLAEEPQAAWPGGSLSVNDLKTGLTPNTQYSVQARLCEQPSVTEYCSSSLPVAPVNFATDPFAPTTPASLTGVQARQITANWTDGSANPGTSVYEVDYCTGGFGLGTCAQVTQTKSGGTSRVIAGLTPETAYYVRVKTRNVLRPAWPDSDWLNIGSTTTIAEVTQAASITPNPVNQSTGTLSVQVDGDNNAPGMTYNWVITPPAGVLAPTMCANNGTAASRSCIATFRQIGNGYSATVTVTDSLGRTVTSSISSFNVVPIPKTVSVSPLNPTVNQGDPAVTFTASAIDQFDDAVTSPPVTWSTPGGTGGNSFSNGTFTPNGSAGTYTVRASITMNSVTKSTETSITVQQAAGTVTITGPASGFLNQTQTFTYTAVVEDRFGNPINNPQLAWSIDPPPGLVGGDPDNTIDSVSGLFTAKNPGNYTVRAITDINGSQAQGASPITVNAVPATVEVSPSPATVVTGNSQTFNATVKDPFGVVLNVDVLWQIDGGGSLSTGGPSASTTFTAAAPGSFTLTASTGSVSTNVPVTVLAAGPYCTQAPTATLNPDNKTINASAPGCNDNVSGPASLLYTWSLVSGPAGARPGFPDNGANGAQNITITLDRAGTYTFQVRVHNDNGVKTESAPPVTVNQVLSGLSACPNGFSACPSVITVKTASQQAFAAMGMDQFGASMPAGDVNWSSSDNNISAAGAYSRGTLGNGILVRAHNGPITSNAITVNVVSFDVSGAKAYPVPYKSTQRDTITFAGLGSSAKIRVYTTSGRLVFSQEVTSDTFEWPVKNSDGEKIASGVYFYVIESPEQKKDGKLIIIQ